MALQYRRKITLWRSKKPATPLRDQSELYATLKIPTRRSPSPVSLGFRWKGLTWNTRQGWASARTPIKGLTWRDRD